MSQLVFASVTLAGSPPTDVITSVGISSRQANQIAESIRGSYATPLDRGNRLTNLAFTIERSFSTLLDAEKFAHDIEGDLPASGSLVHTLSDGTSVRTYADATLESVSAVARGMSVSLSLSFIATEVATS